MTNEKEIKEIEKLCYEEIRPEIIQAIYNTGMSGHPAGSFSIVEQIAVLYKKILRIDLKNLKERDIFILGCGHNAPALYSILAKKGFYSTEKFIKGYRNTNMFSGHPKMSTPGVELTSGSLGNALSAAVEWANGLDLREDKTSPIVYFLDGNGGFQEGATQEALYNAGRRKIHNLVYILNDNQFGLDGPKQENYRECLQAMGFYVIGNQINRENHVSRVDELCDKSSVLFEDDRTDYFIDGNDVSSVWKTLSFVRDLIDYKGAGQPIAIIFNTVKGAGHMKMAGDNAFHAKMPGIDFNAAMQELRSPTDYTMGSHPKKERIATGKVLGRVFERIATDYPNVIALSADTGNSTGLSHFLNVDKGRYIDVGCREQHLVLGCMGVERKGHPVIACTFSQFLVNRAKEQIITLTQQYEYIDLKTSIILVGSHQGLSCGKDDMTHHCIDAYSLAAVPNLTVLHASDTIQFEQMIRNALDNPGIYYIGIEKESEIKFRQDHTGCEYQKEKKNFKEFIPPYKEGKIAYYREKFQLHDENYVYNGKPEVKMESKDVYVIATGLRTYDAVFAANIVRGVGVIQIPQISPFDISELKKILGECKKILVVEENTNEGGLGQRIKSELYGTDFEIRQLFVSGFASQGTYCQCLDEKNLDVAAIVKEIKKFNN